MQNLFPTFFSEANAKGARSTALHSLQWAMGMLLCSIPISLWANAPTWLLVVLVSALLVVLTVFLIAYIFLLQKEPDALRSESFTLSKMAIERGLVGDNHIGLSEPTKAGSKVITQETHLISDQGRAE